MTEFHQNNDGSWNIAPLPIERVEVVIGFDDICIKTEAELREFLLDVERVLTEKFSSKSSEDFRMKVSVDLLETLGGFKRE